MGDRVLRFGALVVGMALLLSACTSSGGTPTSSDPVQTETIVSTRTATPSIGPTAPISTGPTTAADASTCPLLSLATAAPRIGMRLARVSVLKSGGKVVGCRFYALQNSPLHNSEHLPPANQPAIEITTARYASDIAAHNAFVLVATKGNNPVQASMGVDNTGVCYQIPFFVNDKGKDWACAFSIGKTMVQVKTVALLSFNVIAVAREVARKI
jgi:hypothetical protein